MTGFSIFSLLWKVIKGYAPAAIGAGLLWVCAHAGLTWVTSDHIHTVPGLAGAIWLAFTSKHISELVNVPEPPPVEG